MSTQSIKHEFVCTDCGCDVYDFLGVPIEVTRCRVCEWIAEAGDLPPDVIARLRGQTRSKGAPT